MNNENWQSECDTMYRRGMILNIIRLFEKKSPSRTFPRKKLVLIAKQVEMSLYREAESLLVYLDKTTLQQRMRQVAINSIRESTIQLIANSNLDCNCSLRCDENNNSNVTSSTLENFECLSLRRL